MKNKNIESFNDYWDKFDNLKCDICHKNKATQISESVYPMFLCDDCYVEQLSEQIKLVNKITGGEK